MNILVVAATELEIPLVRSGLRGRHQVDVLITGVGMLSAGARTARRLALGHYDVAFNFGVCGSFDPALGLGTVVHVTAEQTPELGAEDGDAFISIRELGLASDDVIENVAPPDVAALAALPAVRAITVNTVHGNAASIAAIVRRCQPQVESMEGAGFACACNISSVPYAQVRAVSNVVEQRNRDAWRLDLAIHNLKEVAVRMLDTV